MPDDSSAVSAGNADPEIAGAQPAVLVVDDEPDLRRLLTAVLAPSGYNIVTADCGRDAVKKARQLERLDVVVTDYLMPDLNGLEVIEAVRKRHPGVRALVISGHGTIRAAVEAIRLGVIDFVTKPYDIERVRAAVVNAVEASGVGDVPVTVPSKFVKSAPGAKSVNGAGRDAIDEALRGTIGDAPETRRMVEQLLRAADARSTVLLLGESGTGKEVAARLLHDAGPRRKAPFVAVSCAALPETLLESELFGHEKSAFTGAMAAKPGRFELAHGGTLFLDEIGDIPHLTQVKLLRALQEREVSRLGGVKTIKVDVRVVAATNRDLFRAVQEGTFRLDLYYRLHVIPIVLPPLRERREDIASLARHFLSMLEGECGRSFPDGFTADAIEVLEAHGWPGNIRELQNAIEYAVVMSPPKIRQLWQALCRVKLGIQTSSSLFTSRINFS